MAGFRQAACIIEIPVERSLVAAAEIVFNVKSTVFSYDGPIERANFFSCQPQTDAFRARLADQINHMAYDRPVGPWPAVWMF